MHEQGRQCLRESLFDDCQTAFREDRRNTRYLREHRAWQAEHQSGASSCDSSDKNKMNGLIVGEFGLGQQADIFHGIKKRRLFSLDESDLNEYMHSSEVRIFSFIMITFSVLKVGRPRE